MKCLVLHGKNSSPEKIRWLTEPISKFAEVNAPYVEQEVEEIVSRFKDDRYECVAGHSRGGTAALILGSLMKAEYVIAVSSPTDRNMQLEYLSMFEKGTVQSRLYKDLSVLKNLDKTSPINYANQLVNSKVLLIYGEKDEIVPLDHGRKMCDLLKGNSCNFVIIPGMKHSPAGHQIGELSKIIEDFLVLRV